MSNVYEDYLGPHLKDHLIIVQEKGKYVRFTLQRAAMNNIFETRKYEKTNGNKTYYMDEVTFSLNRKRNTLTIKGVIMIDETMRNGTILTHGLDYVAQ